MEPDDTSFFNPIITPIATPVVDSPTPMPVIEGLITSETPITHGLLEGETISTSMSIPIFAFAFLFILCAIYLAKKMKLIRQSAVDKQGYSEL